jgi:hypothetical protein
MLSLRWIITTALKQGAYIYIYIVYRQNRNNVQCFNKIFFICVFRKISFKHVIQYHIICFFLFQGPAADATEALQS